MPTTSSRLNRKALAHIALRKSKKKHANAKKEANNLIETAAGRLLRHQPVWMAL